MPSSDLPRLPRGLSLLAGTLPLMPVSLALTRLTRDLSARHPGIRARLGSFADRRFLLDLEDLPVVLLLEPGGDRPRVRACRRGREPGHDARIRGPVSAFLGMLHGRLDGDALFFSRDLVVEGDTEAVLALRNAIDDAEIDLSEEAGHLTGLAAPAVRGALGLAERLTGVALSRGLEAGA
ncbi:ubiquinone anaerobic biosynthesis accessory factor UbiT [Rubellimicrobium mesophilum]|nr:SCP2 sterol-binding domain-containing protein [Rubellimicrobium mesophilum]